MMSRKKIRILLGEDTETGCCAEVKQSNSEESNRGSVKKGTKGGVDLVLRQIWAVAGCKLVNGC